MLWRALETASETNLDLRGPDYENLVQRALRQRERVEHYRLAAAKKVLAPRYDALEVESRACARGKGAHSTSSPARREPDSSGTLFGGSSAAVAATRVAARRFASREQQREG